MGVGDQGWRGQEDSNEKRKFDRSMISLSPLQIRKYPDGTELISPKHGNNVAEFKLLINKNKQHIAQ